MGIFLKPFCLSCKNGDNTKFYALWHYCKNPKNTKEFAIIRHHEEFTLKPRKNTFPEWCPFKD